MPVPPALVLAMEGEEGEGRGGGGGVGAGAGEEGRGVEGLLCEGVGGWKGWDGWFRGLSGLLSCIVYTHLPLLTAEYLKKIIIIIQCLLFQFLHLSKLHA